MASAAEKAARTLHVNGKLRPAGMGGTSSGLWKDEDIRGDKIMWVTECPPGGDAARIIDLACQLECKLRRDLGMEDAKSFPISAQLSAYDAGMCRRSTTRTSYVSPSLNMMTLEFCSPFFMNEFRPQAIMKLMLLLPLCGAGSHGYVRHLDTSPKHTNVPCRRLVTAVYYLNQGWKAGDGGCLRVHCPPNGVPSSTSEPSHVVDIEPFSDRLVIFRSDKVEHEVLPNVEIRMALTLWFYSSMQVLAFVVTWAN